VPSNKSTALKWTVACFGRTFRETAVHNRGAEGAGLCPGLFWTGLNESDGTDGEEGDRIKRHECVAPRVLLIASPPFHARRCGCRTAMPPFQGLFV